MSKDDDKEDHNEKGSPNHADPLKQIDTATHSRQVSDSRFGWNSQDTIDKDTDEQIEGYVFKHLLKYESIRC
jgi:hypothetical protein